MDQVNQIIREMETNSGKHFGYSKFYEIVRTSAKPRKDLKRLRESYHYSHEVNRDIDLAIDKLLTLFPKKKKKVAESDAPPEYKITTVSDFFNVPLDRLDACLEDFKVYIQTMSNFDEMLGIDKTPRKFDESFVWKDDSIIGVTKIEFFDGGKSVCKIDMNLEK